MQHTELHDSLSDLVSEVLPAKAASRAVEFVEIERAASSGCSVCARALVNASQVSVDLAVDSAVRPSSRLRERVLRSVAGRSRASSLREPLPRALDPSAAVAHSHIGAAGDGERTRFIDEIGALREREGEQTPRILAQLEHLTGFPLLFVSIVRGERVGYRVQRGLGAHLVEFRDMRREMTFCTHCVASGTPLVVENAAREPFFRASKMVRRFGIGAYVGVPLRGPSVVFGTLCALDFRPRTAPPEVVELLELFAQAVLAEIGCEARPSYQKLPNGASVLAEGLFYDVLAVTLALAKKGEPAALLVVGGPAAGGLASAARPHELVGQLGDDALGLLLAGADSQEAARRAAEVRARFPGAEVTFAAASGEIADARHWQTRARGLGA